MLDLFTGTLFDPEARRALLALDSKQPVDGNKSPLGGLRPLIAMSCDSDIGIQQRAASSFVTLLELAQAGAAKQPVEQLAALVAQLSRFTPSARSHAALGLATAALCPEQREALSSAGLLAGALKQLLELCSVEAQPDVQGAAALALALLSQERGACEQMLSGGAVGALAALVRSSDHDAVRCAAYTLAALAQLPEARPRIARAFPPRVLVMVRRAPRTSSCRPPHGGSPPHTSQWCDPPSLPRRSAAPRTSSCRPSARSSSARSRPTRTSSCGCSARTRSRRSSRPRSRRSRRRRGSRRRGRCTAWRPRRTSPSRRGGATCRRSRCCARSRRSRRRGSTRAACAPSPTRST